MTNGFYNTENFSNTKIKKFIKDAIFSAYKIQTETKYKNGTNTRQINK
jgi:hypothetical protein